jgi:CTP synthase
MDKADKIISRDNTTPLGGTMRLGSDTCQMVSGTLMQRIYNSEIVTERYRHRYEVNTMLVDSLVKSGLVVAAKSMDDNLVAAVELAEQKHPWFLGVQFHPEFTSSPINGHPLFISFIEAVGRKK